VALSVKVVRLSVVAWESLAAVWDVETTVNGSFKSAEYFVSGSGSGETGVEEATEWTWAVFSWFNVVLVTVDFGLTDVGLIEFEFLQQATGQEETSAVVRGVVLKADSETVFWELVGVSSGDDNITGHSRVGNLANNVSVGGSNNKTILWRIEFVFELRAQALACLIIGLSDLTTLELWLVAFEVGLVLLDLDELINSLLSHITLIFTGHLEFFWWGACPRGVFLYL
jgi:hypothetical protein